MTSLPLRLKILRRAADLYGWLPLLLVIATVVAAVLTLTTHWLAATWFYVLIAVSGVVGTTALLFTEWEQQRVALYHYEHMGQPRKLRRRPKVRTPSKKGRR
jgi:hypothetical protein